jgi:hypothetical protein
MPPATQTQRTQGKRPGDLTGVRGQQLAKSRDAVKAEAKVQIAESLEAERLAKAETEVDYSAEARKKAREAALAGIVDEGGFEPRPKTRRIRVNWPVEDMTFGREVIREAEYDEQGVMTVPPVLGGLRTMKFEPGRWYTVDIDVAEHLAFLGYVYE